MKIALFTGGLTEERPVSIASATNVNKLLDFADTETFVMPEDLEKFVATHKSFDFAIPIIHGKGGEDGVIQGLFESLSIPYLFSGVQASSIAIDKKRTKQIAKALGYTVTKESSVENSSFPLFAKPRFGGSSVASGLCKSQADLDNLKKLCSDPFILEQPLKGREFTVGVIEQNGKTIALPVIEIITPENSFFDFEHKYDPNNLAGEICPAQIPIELNSALQAEALAIHTEIGARHISRSDFIVTNTNEIFFLEINTIPGMTNTSLIPKMVAAAGLNLRDLLKQWANEALSN
ncbi:MAG: D-alanine/D-alanine ligase [Candidatus Doudnabacteria bacterium]|nr:D-alanine/D-alanine ligase [Candidatus Doudnabacteria bacterium]